MSPNSHDQHNVVLAMTSTFDLSHIDMSKADIVNCRKFHDGVTLNHFHEKSLSLHSEWNTLVCFHRHSTPIYSTPETHAKYDNFRKCKWGLPKGSALQC